VVTKPKKEGRKEGRKGFCCCCCIIMEQSLFLVSKDWGQRRGEEVLYLLGKFGAIVVDGRKM
jgi:hypothetical protein